MNDTFCPRVKDLSMGRAAPIPNQRATAFPIKKTVVATRLLILSIVSIKCESRLQLNFLILFHNILKYIQLAKIVMIQVLGSVEDEQMFNNLNFIKLRIINLTYHLDFSFLHV
jgi:hypothetical protein